MAILPHRRRKSGPRRALETVQSALKVYTSLKVAKAGPKAAKAVAKGYAGAKGAKGGLKVGRLLAVPVALAAVFALVRRKRRGGSDDATSVADRAPGPAASPVSPAPEPRMGEAGAPRSSTTTASPPRETAPEDPGAPIASPSSATTGAVRRGDAEAGTDAEGSGANGSAG